jgi:crotonobetainyl-CoA:carnitine CoA-transferase CaiB-like acyl-CoA transferase
MLTGRCDLVFLDASFSSLLGVAEKRANTLRSCFNAGIDKPPQFLNIVARRLPAGVRRSLYLMPGPLQGIRVIDFGRFIAAPYCAMLLADMGADVIRVERRGGGEDRFVGPITETGEGGMFLSLNRNKRGISLDLGHELAPEIIRRLANGADVVVVNLPIDVMKKVGLDYDSLRAAKDDIILVMASAFGPDGPYSNRVGFDTVAQAMSGAMALTGFPDLPVRAIVSFEDYGTALHAAFGAMVALYNRQKTGRGQSIDVSLLATGVTFMVPLLAELAVTGTVRKQQGNTGYYTAPSDTYRTRDGWIVVPTIGDQMFRRWARLIGKPEFINDPRFVDDITRAANCDLINQEMSAWCASRTRDEATAELERARIPCGPVYSLDEVLSDPQVEARRLLERVEFPSAARPVPIAATPVRLSETPGGVRHRAPQVGEHTDQVLSELGFTVDQIRNFRSAGAI